MAGTKRKFICKKLERVHKEKEISLIDKKENFEMNEILKRDNLKRIERIQDYEKELTKGKLKSKEERMELFKKQKQEMIERRRELQKEIGDKKVSYMSKFDHLMKKAQVNPKGWKEIADEFQENASISQMMSSFLLKSVLER